MKVVAEGTYTYRDEQCTVTVHVPKDYTVKDMERILIPLLDRDGSKK